MKYIVTKHAQKRREHHALIPKEILINLLKNLDTQFEVYKKEDMNYKFFHKSKCAIVKKQKNTLVLITQRGFDKNDWIVDSSKLVCKPARDKEKKEKRINDNKGEISKIYRTNFVGRKIACGRIIDLSQIEDINNKSSFKYKLQLDSRLFYKFIIPVGIKHETYFNNFEEITTIVHKVDNESIINNLERRQENSYKQKD